MEDVSTDPETYLRLACEHVVLTHDRDKGYPPGADAAAVGRAFIAAKILEEGKVRSVLDEYAFAITLRLPGGHSGGNWRSYRHMQRIFDGVTLSSVRAVPCHIPIGGTDNSRTLDWVHFGENHTRLDLFGTSDPDQLGVNGGVAHFRRDAGGHLRSDSLTVKDDQGTTAYAHRSGGSWTETNWELQYSTSVALSADSQWLEIDGYHVDLPTRGPQLEVKVEALEDTDPVRSMLYREVLEHPSQPGANPMVAGVIEALIATGALRSDDPLVGETELIVRSLASRAALPNLPEIMGVFVSALLQDRRSGRHRAYRCLRGNRGVLHSVRLFDVGEGLLFDRFRRLAWKCVHHGILRVRAQQVAPSLVGRR